MSIYFYNKQYDILFLNYFCGEAIENSKIEFISEYLSDYAINISYDKVKGFVDVSIQREVIKMKEFKGIIVEYFLWSVIGKIGHWILIFIDFQTRVYICSIHLVGMMRLR